MIHIFLKKVASVQSTRNARSLVSGDGDPDLSIFRTRQKQKRSSRHSEDPMRGRAKVELGEVC
jgi:hypothetical protein